MKKLILILLIALFVDGYSPYTATAYSLKGKTASGARTSEGIIAADPSVLPMHTKVHIKGYGNFVVKDTGGKIKGKRIDIWMRSRAKAIKFGRRKVQLKVIGR